MTGRPSSEARALAQIMGEKTYEGTVHEKCGTNIRYVIGSGCVHCARTIATEQREARARLKAEQQTARQEQHADAIDDTPDPEPEVDPFEQSINDLL